MSESGAISVNREYGARTRETGREHAANRCDCDNPVGMNLRHNLGDGREDGVAVIERDFTATDGERDPE